MTLLYLKNNLLLNNIFSLEKIGDYNRVMKE